MSNILSFSKWRKLYESEMAVEASGSNKTHSAMSYLADKLIPFGFKKTYNAGATLGPNGVFNGLSKGTDESGAYIYDSSLNNKIQLIVTINRDVIVNKEYKKTAPDYMVDSTQILKDLGDYKTWEFKKPPYRG